RKPDTSTTNVVVIGADRNDGPLEPWNVAEGSAGALSPDGVVIDRTYAKTLGISQLGEVSEIGGKRVRVEAMTDGIRSFTTSPYLFDPLNKARALLSIPSDQATFYIAKLARGAKPAEVKRELETRLHGVSIFTKEEFRERNLDYWLFGTGAGVALIGGAILGL